MVYVIQEYGVKESRLPPRLLGGSIRPCTLQHCVWAVKSGPVSKPRLKASLGVMDYGLWIMGYGLWAMGYGLWVMGYGLWVMSYGLWVMGYGLWVMGFGLG